MNDIENFISILKDGHILQSHTTQFICSKACELMVNEPNIVPIRSPITVVGDIHGQLYDLFELFKVGGEAPETNYIFLGDYVDRGSFSVETISLLICLKIRFPSKITLLRGNHESRQITHVYGFYTDCINKYGNTDVYQYFTEMFDYMPIAALIDQTILCIHGGLSPSMHSIDQIRCVQRFQEIPHEGCFADLMWSDPDPDNDGFRLSTRQIGYTFGSDIVDRFVYYNNLSTILRAHQLCMDGYQVLFDEKLMTVWSAPNYCYRVQNLASILEFDEHQNRNFNIFCACPNSLRMVYDESQSKADQFFNKPIESNDQNDDDDSDDDDDYS